MRITQHSLKFEQPELCGIIKFVVEIQLTASMASKNVLLCSNAFLKRFRLARCECVFNTYFCLATSLHTTYYGGLSFIFYVIAKCVPLLKWKYSCIFIKYGIILTILRLYKMWYSLLITFDHFVMNLYGSINTFLNSH